MAYAAVAQADHELPYRDALDPAMSRPAPSSPPSSDHDSEHGDPATASHAAPGSVSVASLLQSLDSSHSYEMVDGHGHGHDHDHDHDLDLALALDDPSPTPQGLGLGLDTCDPRQEDAIAFEPADVPMRTASISENLPLKHPTPDLHTMQGGFVKNVERLEESAERLSMTSSLEEELHKMKLDQKRLERQSSAPANIGALRPSVQRQFSTGSWTNSIIGLNQAARTGGYSPSGYVASPTGSLSSRPQSKHQHLDRQSSQGSRRGAPRPEPVHEARPLDLMAPPPVGDHLPADPPPPGSPHASSGSIQQDRPLTSGSNDTYRQAQAAFTDFDGVHYTSGTSDKSSIASRKISLRHPPLARDSKAYREPQPGERMIYYPAPVPVMLNLPPRLSRANVPAQEKRRLQALSNIPDDMRQAAPWLADQDLSKLPSPRTSVNLPAQLRASAYFQQPGIAQDLQLKDGSAVNTLNSILDAAAYAPVSAFTDHPIAGQLGTEVYGSHKSPRKSMQSADRQAKKRRSSLSNILTRGSRLSRAKSQDFAATEADDGAVDDAHPEDPEDLEGAEGADTGSASDSDDEEPQTGAGAEFFAAPTTLLAELQMRKEQQKQRNRTAADAFPNGMHSTLLELDAVTQLQQKARKTKHVTLAWEDHAEADRQNFDDDDVPLAVLFADKERPDQAPEQPFGLLQRRELEDNEPLSHRRARLRGEPLQTVKDDARPPTDEAARAPFIDDVPGLAPGVLPDEEGETLAQRAARIKLEKVKGTGDRFADELTTELGLGAKVDAPPASVTPDGDETLAQRRKRLKEEALREGRQVSGGSANPSRPKTRSVYSMADILQAHPVGLQSAPAAQPLGFAPAPAWNAVPHGGPFVPRAPAGMSQPQLPYMTDLYSRSNAAMFPPAMAMPTQQPFAGYPYGYGIQPYVQDPMMGPPLDPKQRAQIDRWRQGVA